MDKIPVKQVEGAVDINTSQRIEGTKSFNEIIIAQDLVNGPFMRFNGGFIYWLQHENLFDEIGNSRIGLVNGVLTMQTYQDVWQNI